jgi:hypothetical protein
MLPDRTVLFRHSTTADDEAAHTQPSFPFLSPIPGGGETSCRRLAVACVITITRCAQSLSAAAYRIPEKPLHHKLTSLAMSRTGGQLG